MIDVIRDKEGYLLIIISALILIFLVGTIALINYIKGNTDAIRRLNNIKEGTYLAEAGIAKTVWCLNHDVDADCGGTAGSSYPGESSIAVGDGMFTTAVTDNGQEKIIVSTGTTNNGVGRTIRVNAHASPETTSVSFIFGAQVGDGGMQMGNNSVVVGSGGNFGNVYSNGSIICGGGAAISGTVEVAGSGNKIDGCDIGYDGDGNLINDNADAWAQTLVNCRVAHDIYHPSSGNVSSCPNGLGAMGGTIFDNSDLPPPLDLPITAQMITDWETEAAAGNGGVPIVGPYTPTDGETLGPVKIEGDLYINGGDTLYIGGIIWVEGDFTIENGAQVELVSAFGPNSTVIIADNPSDLAGSGIIDIDNGVIIEGSGDPDSFLQMVSTNSSINAIDIKNNSSGAIFVATNGTARINNKAMVREVLGYRVELGNNAILEYKSGLASINFASGPGGAWRTKRETWQIINN